MTKTLSISLIIVALVIGIGLGFTISPEYASMGNKDSHLTDLGAADEKYDLRFIDSMIYHHMGAIDMAREVLEKSQNSELVALADNIITSQEKEIDQMYEWKKDWYNNTSKVKMNEFSMNVNLGDYDEKFDLRFINAMVAHHMTAVEMAKDAQKKSVRNEILNIADAIIFAQESEIDQMEDWRFSLYGIK